jgi:cysteine desulfurase
MRRIYLDYAATTPVDARVFRAMRPYFSEHFGNPSASHRWGQEAFRAIWRARQIVGRTFGCPQDGVVFTASATEANNLAIRGVIAGSRAPALSPPHIITTAIEHDSVLEVCRALEREGAAEVTYVGVDRDGLVNPEDIGKALKPETVLVSVMYANNEIGTIQPIAEISEIIRNFRKSKFQNQNSESNPHSHITQLHSYPFFHTDAVQAAQFLDCDIERLGADLMTISSHKMYGPKGAAALLMRQPSHHQRLAPIVWGGGQERSLRSGTENTPAIVGFGKAIELGIARREEESRRLSELRDYFIGRLLALRNDIRLNGSATMRLPNNVNVSFPGVSSDVMLTALDRWGIAASAGSACQSYAAKPSHVLEALGISEERRKSAVRFSLGRHTKRRDLDDTVRAIAKFLPRG